MEIKCMLVSSPFPSQQLLKRIWTGSIFIWIKTARQAVRKPLLWGNFKSQDLHKIKVDSCALPSCYKIAYKSCFSLLPSLPPCAFFTAAHTDLCTHKTPKFQYWPLMQYSSSSSFFITQCFNLIAGLLMYYSTEIKSLSFAWFILWFLIITTLLLLLIGSWSKSAL